MLSIEGNIVKENNVERGRIEIDIASGLISKITETTGVADIILKEELIFPGFIDLHVHARECSDHTQDYKEDFKTVSEASINGGVTAIAEMPNNPTPPIDEESYEAKKKLTEKSLVEVVLYAGIGPHTSKLSRKVPYKAFMGPSVGDLFFHSNEELEEVIKNYEGENISFHCEDPILLEENKNADTHETKRPKEAEIKAVDFAIYLIQKYNLKGKVCHASTLESIQKIIKAREAGVNISAEITPHHLFFDVSMINDTNRKWLQINPPIRQGAENRLALIQLLKEGKIDYLATDHAPHTIEEKEKGTSGMPHLDTYGYFVVWLMKEHNFTPMEIARVCSTNPANFLNEFSTSKYGKMEVDFMGSFTIIDLQKKYTVKKEDLKTKCLWSPFEDMTFDGDVVMTIIRGKILKDKIQKNAK
ncbi:MAG: dihydroorotase [Candidatus Pacebacteria bacterium]|nr:dihydroorotase [Candidatus Paceibacterota bacterium]MCF7862879.1 dihydroorotase [Candidatus Paceibacterota bacterium]